jgi:hypothetical protein
MKNRMMALAVTGLILGAAACEREDVTTREYSRNDTGAAETPRAATDYERQTAPAPGTAMRNDAAAAAKPGAATAGERTVMTGKLDVQNEDARTFILEGNAQTYVAPQQADLDALDGEQVTVMMDANGRVTAIEITADREG